jgi:hypothetical protein
MRENTEKRARSSTMLYSDLNEDSRCFSLIITESVHSCSFSLSRTVHFRINNIVRYKLTLGEDTKTLVKIKSFIMSQRLQARYPNRNTKFLFFLLDPCNNFPCKSSKLAGRDTHSSTSLNTLSKILLTHRERRCVQQSTCPHSLHSGGPDQFFFANCPAD